MVFPLRIKRLASCFMVLFFPFAYLNLYVGMLLTPDLLYTGLKYDGEETSFRRHNTTNNNSTRSSLTERLVAVPSRVPTNHACDGYDGIYHIAMGDIGGAAGTIFFQFVIGQILYAEQHNLLPYVHLNDVSEVVYDSAIHGIDTSVRIPRVVAANATAVHRPGGHLKDWQPGPPDLTTTTTQDIGLRGTGVWEHYFEPVSDFVPGDSSCKNKLWVTMDLKLITPGIHGFAEWAPHCWRYDYLPDYATKPYIPLTEWLEPQRRIAHRIVSDYIKFRPQLEEEAERVNPNCHPKSPCLGLHIRQSDKANGRIVLSTAQFLPYAQAFVQIGGAAIFVATDSHKVLEEIRRTWPVEVKQRLRTHQDIIRSNNTQAVFRMGVSPHRTNAEVLVDIRVLSKCQYLIHGLSAVSEASIWINNDQLHTRSVNLEDPDHITPAAFAALLQMDHNSTGSKALLPRPVRTNRWFDAYPRPLPQQPTHHACDTADGVLLISSVGKEAQTGRGFFVSVINQLLYAQRHNLKPYIHLRSDAERIFDTIVHNSSGVRFEANHALVDMLEESQLPVSKVQPKTMHLSGNGIWDTYFEPVSDFVPGDESCRNKTVLEMSTNTVERVECTSSWAIRSWRYDCVTDQVWTERTIANMRDEAAAVASMFRLRPYILQHAERVTATMSSNSCLGVHIRNIDKYGKFRRKVKMESYVEYMEAFVKAGGRAIFMATDSRSSLQYIVNSYPDLARFIVTQGNQVVRSSKGKKREWPAYFFESHHRVVSEALVDTAALAKCDFLVHGFSSLSEASIYMNPTRLSVNVEAPSMALEDFRSLVQKRFQALDTGRANKARKQPFVQSKFRNATLIEREGRKCRSNAIVYLVQKTHSSYERDSYSTLLKSLDLLRTNYLSIGEHIDNVDIYLFHTGDFDSQDFIHMENRLGSDFWGTIRMVDISNSPYWERPKHHRNDNPENWYAWPLFSEGYRKMIHWFAIGIWRFFDYLNQVDGCSYRYLLRLDEDSYIHSPIRYDIFEFMRSNDFKYGYRMCAYEMKVSQRMWVWWSRQKKNFQPQRELDLDMCGFYNNFFVADLQFFLSKDVQQFLNFIDRQGHIFRRRLGDLMIHSMVAYAYALPRQIHRFLDFTYEHKTLHKIDRCIAWGGIQAGYNDENASETLQAFYDREGSQRNCSLRSVYLGEEDLSPSYSHLNGSLGTQISLHTITAGAVELAGKGILSG